MGEISGGKHGSGKLDPPVRGGFVDSIGKLGMTDAEFLARSVQLWGRVLSAEVDARSDPGDSPQKRGRITRVLLDELREVARRGDD